MRDDSLLLLLGYAPSHCDQQQNFQIEGFFFFIFAGVFGGVIIHYINAKIIGPLINGRNWCGWYCWTPMILDFLPFKKSLGRKKGFINSSLS